MRTTDERQRTAIVLNSLKLKKNITVAWLNYRHFVADNVPVVVRFRCPI